MENLKDWFVYQDGENEHLFASCLSEEEAEEAQATLDDIIGSEFNEVGCSCCGRLSDPEDKLVAERLGLI